MNFVEMIIFACAMEVQSHRSLEGYLYPYLFKELVAANTIIKHYAFATSDDYMRFRSKELV